MAESSGRRMFHEDIFAEDNGKFSWQPLGKAVSSVPSEISNYNIHAGRGKDSSNSPSSEEDSFYKPDSNSLKRSFRKRGSSSASDGNASSSPRPAKACVPHERVLPSIYDDDARSGSPSGVFEKKDLAFQSSFKKEFNKLQTKGFGNSSLYVELNTTGSTPNQEIEEYSKERNSSNRSSSPNVDLKREYKERSKSYRPSKSRSRSREIQKRFRSKSRSSSREKRNGSRNKDRLYDRPSKSRSPGSHRLSRSPSYSKKARSPDVRRKTRSPDLKRKSPSPVTQKRTRSPARRRSRSKDSRRRSHSRDSRRRSSSREVRRRSRSKDIRRRSRSRSYDRHRRRGRRSSSRDRYRRRRYSRSRSHSRNRSRGSSSRKPGSLPLSTSGGAMTPQMALQQTMAAMSAKAQAMTGIALPKYYNPAAVNPLKYAEQVQKRKLLWQTKEKVDEQPKNTVWDKLKFDQDQDGKMTAKFRKLMGIKSEGSVEDAESEKESALKKQADLFRDLDQQYEMARVTTHTQRGVGLGYSATTLYPPVQK